MNLRTRIRRWWIGADLYDFAVMVCAVADNSEQQGRANAHAFLRANGLEHLIAVERDES